MSKHLLINLLLCVGLLFSGCNKSKTIAEKSQLQTTPNIIILFCDDLGYGDLGITGHPNIRTPNLDRMAMQGMRLSNFYSGSPACTASRYALLTGKYPARSGFDWVLYPKSPRGIHPKEITLAESLKQAGYATACYGKWHLGSTKKNTFPFRMASTNTSACPTAMICAHPNGRIFRFWKGMIRWS